MHRDLVLDRHGIGAALPGVPEVVVNVGHVAGGNPPEGIGRFREHPGPVAADMGYEQAKG